MPDTDTFTLNNIATTGCNVKQNINKMIVEQVHLVDIEKSTVGLCKKPRFKRLYTTGQGLLDINSTADTVFRSTERKINNRNRNILNGKVFRSQCFLAFCRLFSFNVL